MCFWLWLLQVLGPSSTFVEYFAQLWFQMLYSKLHLSAFLIILLLRFSDQIRDSIFSLVSMLLTWSVF